MIRWRRGVVTATGRSWRGAVELTAVLPDGSEVPALAHPPLVGEPEVGDAVLLNVAALELGLGTGGFMAVGGYAAFKLATAFPGLNILVVFVLSGLVAAGVGLIFGIPSLRIKGFYLAVATLASQFFLIWLFNKVAWFSNYAPSGTITAPARTVRLTEPSVTSVSVAPRRNSISGVPATLPSVTGWMRW